MGAKLTLLDAANTGFDLVSTVNQNSDLIEVLADTLLSRDGTAPNTMLAPLDMNSNRIINLRDPLTDSEAATKRYVDSYVTTITGDIQQDLDSVPILFYQSNAPSDPKVGDFWIDSDDNKIYYWNGTSWGDVTDARFTTLATDVTNVQGSISTLQALQASDNSLRIDDITQLQGSLTTVEGEVDALQANSGNVIFAQDAQPTASNIGDLWIDTNDSNRIYRWNGTSWVEVTDTRIAITQSTANSNNSRLLVIENDYVTASVTDSLQAQVTTVSNDKAQVFRQTGEPSTATAGDLWIDTDDDNHLYVYTGTQWSSARDTSIEGSKTYAQASAPVDSGQLVAGDLWFDTDDGNKPYRWDGSAWVEVADNRIVTTEATATSNLARIVTIEGDYVTSSVTDGISSSLTTTTSTANTALTNAATAQGTADSAFTLAQTVESTANSNQTRITAVETNKAEASSVTTLSASVTDNAINIQTLAIGQKETLGNELIVWSSATVNDFNSSGGSISNISGQRADLSNSGASVGGASYPQFKLLDDSAFVDGDDYYYEFWLDDDDSGSLGAIYVGGNNVGSLTYGQVLSGVATKQVGTLGTDGVLITTDPGTTYTNITVYASVRKLVYNDINDELTLVGTRSTTNEADITTLEQTTATTDTAVANLTTTVSANTTNIGVVQSVVGANMVDGTVLGNWIGARNNETLAMNSGVLEMTGTIGGAFGASYLVQGLEVGESYTFSALPDFGTLTSSFRMRYDTVSGLFNSTGQVLPPTESQTNLTFTATAEDMYVGFILSSTTNGEIGRASNISVTKTTNLESRLLAAESTVTTNTADILTVTNAQTTADGAIATLQTDVVAVSDAYDYSQNILINGRLRQKDSEGKPLGIEPVEGITAGSSDRDQLTFTTGGGMVIAGSPDVDVAFGFPAFPVDPSIQYKVTIRHKSSGTAGSGLFLRFNERNGDLGTFTHVGLAASGSASRTSVSDLVSNGPMPGTSWVTTTYTYTPTAGVDWASFSMYNWTGSTVNYEVDYVVVVPDVSSVEGRVTINASAITDIEGNVDTAYGVVVDGNNRIASLRLLSDGTTASVALGGDKIFLGDDTEFETTDNSFITETGGYRYRYGGPFGTSSDLLQWFGADSVTQGSETKTNGIFALATDGKVYYGTSELAGGDVLRGVSLSASAVIANAGGSGGTATSTSITATPVGGDGTYTYQWTKLSSSTNDSYTAQSPTSASSTFRSTGLAANEYRTATFKIVVTETSSGDTAEATLGVSFIAEGP